YVSVVTTGAGSTTLTADQRGVLAPQRYFPRFTDWNVSGDVTLSYQVTPVVFGYATYARSFKSGGINLAGLPLDVANNPIMASATVKPEQVTHYELGLKTQLFDRRATVNISAFWTEISDYQATVTNGQLGVLRGYLANAGKVRTRGVEVDAAYRPTSRLNLYANGAFTDARYVRFVDAPCPPELSGGTAPAAGQTPSAPGTPGGISPANCNISGQALPGVSKWAFSYGAEYDLPARIAGMDGQLYLGFDGSYRSRFSANPSPSIYTNIDGYALTNFRLGFKARDRLNVFAWVRNAFDTNYYDVLALQSGNTGLVVGQPGDPRTFGFTVAKSF
ncbi:MAG: TonB-dependent receptor, partial [Sphingomonas sp.]|nr:TonB-dependent receptor [Sphingomonas sp.]